MKRQLAKEAADEAQRVAELNASNVIIDITGEVDKFIVHENKVYRVFTDQEGTLIIKGVDDREISDEKIWVTLLGRIHNG